jgi:hypothetical protein
VTPDERFFALLSVNVFLFDAGDGIWGRSIQNATLLCGTAEMNSNGSMQLVSFFQTNDRQRLWLLKFIPI